MKLIVLMCVGALTTILPFWNARAATVTWLPTGGTSNWADSVNWSGSAVPTNGDDVVITNAGVGVLLTNSTYALGSLLISNSATLTFSNWDTQLSATNVSILPNSTITCAGPFTNSVMSNRVWILCTNLTLASGASINVNRSSSILRRNLSFYWPFRLSAPVFRDYICDYFG